MAAKRVPDFNLKCSNPNKKTFSGRFTGINGANPTAYRQDPGVAAPVRTGEGVWVIELPPCIKYFISARAMCSATGAFHEVSWALNTQNSSYNNNPTLTITHKTCAYTDIASGPAAEDVVADIHWSVEVAETSAYYGSGA